MAVRIATVAIIAAPIIRSHAAHLTPPGGSAMRFPLSYKAGLPPFRHLNFEGLRELLIGVGYGLIREPQMPQDSLDGRAHVEDLHHLDPDVKSLIKHFSGHHQLLFRQRKGKKRHFFLPRDHFLTSCGHLTERTLGHKGRVVGLVSVLMTELSRPSVMAHRFCAMVPAVKAMRAASQILGVAPPKP